MRSYALGAAVRHPVVTAAVAAIVVVIVWTAELESNVGRAVAYLAVIALSVGAIDLVLDRSGGRPVPSIRVRGLGLETTVLAVSFLGGLVWLTSRFVWNYRPESAIGRLLWLAMLAATVFNALPAVLLLARRYGLGDLGLKPRGLEATPVVMILFAGTATLLFPGATTWRAIVQESGGSVWAVIETALLAAVPEEFFRFAWQTRAGQGLKQPATGWLLASLLWATLHGPKDWDETHSVVQTLTGIANIVPLGLLWGYLTHRTGSFLPSVVLHATNVWGLQNL